MMDSTHFNLFYDRPKAFWRSGTNIVADVLLVEHTQYSIVELIAKINLTKQEASRIYFSYPAVAAKLTVAEVEERISNEKEPLIRKRKEFNADVIKSHIVHQMVAEYIVARLHTKTENPNSSELEMCISPLPGDSINVNTGLLDTIRSKPRDLRPYVATKKELTT